MGRNIIVCFDGTDNQFGLEYSNVIRLVQCLDRNPALQHVYYQPGIGTLPDPTFWNPWTKFKAKAGNFFDRIMAWRLEQNVQDAYAYLMNFWELGDSVYIFGFSRGAYTARVLAGMLHALGLVPRGDKELIPYVMRIYKSIRNGWRDKEAKKKYWDLCDKFRWTFGKETSNPDRRFPVHFLGVWDTVSSFGWFWNPMTFQFTVHNPSIEIIRHAVSIDEKRVFFQQNLMREMDGQDFQQIWFAGDHSDVGGGYTEDMGGLWRVTFDWMVDAAVNAGLHLDPVRLNTVRNQSAIPEKPWAEPIHSRFISGWLLAECLQDRRFPKGISKGQQFRYSRLIRNQQIIHPTVLRRVREEDYRPQNFSEQFIERILNLSDCSEPIRFKW